MTVRALFVAIGTLLASTSHAVACFAPSPPIEPYTSATSRPFCQMTGDYDRCDQWQVDNFRHEVERFIDEMQTFADETQEYASDMLDFAQCQADDAVREWNDFVAGY